MRMLRFTLLVTLIASHCIAQQPPRKALMGMTGKAGASGIGVDSIFPNGTFAAMKLMKADTLVELNDMKLSTMESYSRAASSVRTGELVTARIIRNHQPLTLVGTALMRPY